MDAMQRLERLERIALNQTLIIDQLTALVRELSTQSMLERSMDSSAEALLELMFEEEMPAEALDLAIDWRQRLSNVREIMQTS